MTVSDDDDDDYDIGMVYYRSATYMAACHNLKFPFPLS